METDDSVDVLVVVNVGPSIPKCVNCLSESVFVAVKTVNTCTSEELGDRSRHNLNKTKARGNRVKECDEIIQADLKINLCQ